MPRIPLLQRRVAAPVGRAATATASAFGGQEAAALSGIARGVQQLGVVSKRKSDLERQKAEQERQEEIDAKNTGLAIDAAKDWSGRSEVLRNNAARDGSGFVDQSHAEFDNQTKELLEGIEDLDQREDMAERRLSAKVDMTRDAIRQQAAAKGAFQATEVVDKSNALRTAVMADPSSIGPNMKLGREFIDARQMPEAEKDRLKAEMENDLVVTMFESQLDDGPAGAQKVMDAIDEGAADGIMDAADMQRMRSRAARSVQSGKVTQAGISAENHNLSVKLISSGEASPTEVNEHRQVTALDPNLNDVQRASRLRSINVAEWTGNATNGLKTHSTQEMQRALSEVMAADTSGMSLDERQAFNDRNQAFQDAIDKTKQERENDPAVGVIRDVDTVADLNQQHKDAIDGGDLVAARALSAQYISALKEHQTQRGIPPDVQRSLSVPEADAWAAQLTNPNISADERVGVLNTIGVVYSENLSSVASDIFGGNQQAAPYMFALDMKAHHQRELFIAMDGNFDISEADSKKIDSELDDELEDFTETFSDQNTSVDVTARNSVRTLAEFYVSRGQDPDDAVSAANESVFGHIESLDGVRFPKNIRNLEGVKRAKRGFEQLGARMVGVMMSKGVTQFHDDPSLTDDDQGRIIRNAEYQARTNGDGSGLYLTFKGDSGNLVLGPDGTPIELSWEQLASWDDQRKVTGEWVTGADRFIEEGFFVRDISTAVDLVGGGLSEMIGGL